jgi:hypothetical protein
MRHTLQLRCFFADNYAVSEEFTSLPALSIVMIGFALFVVLLAQAYLTYEERMEQLQEYQTVDALASKLTNPDCFFMREGGLVDVSVLRQDTSSLQRICDQWRRSGVAFFLRLHWDDITEDFPGTCSTTSSHRVAVSHLVGVYLTDAQTIPGVLTVILWRCSE